MQPWQPPAPAAQRPLGFQLFSSGASCKPAEKLVFYPLPSARSEALVRARSVRRAAGKGTVPGGRDGPAASLPSSEPQFPQESHTSDFLGLISYFLAALSIAGDKCRVVVCLAIERWFLLPSLAHGKQQFLSGLVGAQLRWGFWADGRQVGRPVARHPGGFWRPAFNRTLSC